jgi:hypothetical protein
MEDGDGSQVGGTGGEGFLTSICRWYLHNSDENEHM